jgi:hypothetical protein
MGSKNKGGREVRKPKQDKKPKGAATMGTIMPPPSRPSAK